MRILITGALGHIGSALIRYLPCEFPDAEIIMIDNLYTQRYCSLFNLTAKYRFIEGNVRFCKIPESDVTVHLAAYTEPHENMDWNHNYEGTREVLDRSKRLIFPSTLSVLPTPQDAYAMTKLKEESLVSGHTILRLGNLFGASPGMRFHTAVSKFCWQAVTGQPLTIWKTAYEQKRPYLDLIDVIRAICFAIKKDISGTYNLVTETATVADVIRHIECSIPVTLEFVDSPAMNSISQEINADAIKGQDFKFIGSLKHGIANTLNLIRHG